ncbi:MAG: DUF21 domain-containing protein [Gemmatimonadetes bacterium]|nr:DUF21 domain-containing protein [Gemmatimonadota bacterium]
MVTLFWVVGTALAISFLCSILEAVLLSVTHAFAGVMKERDPRAGAWLASMQRRIDEPIAAILTLNTIAHTVGASMGGAIALEVFGDRWIALFSAALTLVILVFSEILPKTIGATWWQGLAPPHDLRAARHDRGHEAHHRAAVGLQPAHHAVGEAAHGEPGRAGDPGGDREA